MKIWKKRLLVYWQFYLYVFFSIAVLQSYRQLRIREYGFAKRMELRWILIKIQQNWNTKEM